MPMSFARPIVPLMVGIAGVLWLACAHAGASGGGGVLPVGSPAPTFSAVDQAGKQVALAELRGQFVVLYFYPKDDTPGCTKEACSFRDAWSPLKKAGVVVLGVSESDAASHAEFAEKYHLPFQLLVDDKGAIAAAYHVPVTLGFAKRITYLIGKDGNIAHVWPAVTPVGHADEILAVVNAAPAP
jgi:peroxiredoxin Q/BCP